LIGDNGIMSTLRSHGLSALSASLIVAFPTFFTGGAAWAQPEPAVTDVVVTATRMPSSRLDFSGSLTRLDANTIDLTGATHHSESLNRIAGVYVQRGSGEESLPAIRSPVLTGPGSCGAFLVLEDGLSLRPVGFCNVNELFELNYEQAGAIEVVRGPGPAVYGANAMHGIVNVITPNAADLPPLAMAVEAGSDTYRRVSLKSGTDAIWNGVGAYGVFTSDGGFRVDSGFEEGKLNLLADRELGSGLLKLRAAGTVLNQETAGFIQGFDAYRNPVLRESNANPESFRDAWSTRLSAQWSRQPCSDCTDSVGAIVRRSSMKFLQHFLVGQPLERNEQTSFALSGSMVRPLMEGLSFHTGVDAELADAELIEFQSGPTIGTPAQVAIRPAGLHYDYDVTATTAGAFGALDWRFAARWRLGAALRLEQTRYDYDNRMIAGNTSDVGVRCPGGCLYSRPEDRDDSFSNLAPKVDLSFDLADRQRLYIAASRGFRPPEMTELYRLQRQQSLADLDSERADNIELGYMGSAGLFDWTLAAYALKKRNVILRDANAFNVSNGRTTHRGLEYELRARPIERVQVAASGTVAWHRYDFTQAIEQGETIVSGRDIDTAPRNVHHVSLGWEPLARTFMELELNYLSRYFVDAANANEYPGHTLVNTRLRYDVAPRWQTTLRITNLLDRRYADRADFAFGNYRYFPGRDRNVFLEIAYTAE
jgi:iron complex outermembrane recepter protein